MRATFAAMSLACTPARKSRAPISIGRASPAVYGIGTILIATIITTTTTTTTTGHGWAFVRE